MKRLKIYLSGPMTGIPEENRPAFMAEAERLKKLGHYVHNPARYVSDTTYDNTWADWIIRDLRNMQVLELDTIALLPGWGNSKGCAVEIAFAKGLGMRIVNAEEIDV
jgi:hypothetical protein